MQNAWDLCVGAQKTLTELSVQKKTYQYRGSMNQKCGCNQDQWQTPRCAFFYVYVPFPPPPLQRSLKLRHFMSSLVWLWRFRGRVPFFCFLWLSKNTFAYDLSFSDFNESQTYLVSKSCLLVNSLTLVLSKFQQIIHIWIYWNRFCIAPDISPATLTQNSDVSKDCVLWETEVQPCHDGIPFRFLCTVTPSSSVLGNYFWWEVFECQSLTLFTGVISCTMRWSDRWVICGFVDKSPAL